MTTYINLNAYWDFMSGGYRVLCQNDEQFAKSLRFLKKATIVGAAASAAGLAGIVADHFIGPDGSKLLKEILSYSNAVMVAGLITSVYCGIEYVADRYARNRLYGKNQQ